MMEPSVSNEEVRPVPSGRPAAGEVEYASEVALHERTDGAASSCRHAP